MDGLDGLFVVLILLFLGLVVGMNYSILRPMPGLGPLSGLGLLPGLGPEGFADQEEATDPDALPRQIDAVLRPMIKDGPELCSLFDLIRSTAFKNTKAGQDITDAEARARVEKEISQGMSGLKPLPCPILTYPKKGSTDLDWLSFVQSIPPNFGEQVLLMALYAQRTLKKQADMLRESLGEGFADICSPEAAAIRRKASKPSEAAVCLLPEDLKPEEIKDAVTVLLKTLVANRNTALAQLKKEGLLPSGDISDMLKAAAKDAEYIKGKAAAAQSGDLIPKAKA